MEVGIMGFRDTLEFLVNNVIRALGRRLQETAVDLLFGAMMSYGGHVTNAMEVIDLHKHFTTPYKALNSKNFNKSGILKGNLKNYKYATNAVGKKGIYHLAVDDTYNERDSKKAPGARYQRLHTQKPNRPDHVFAQNVFAICGLLSHQNGVSAVPLYMQVVDKSGNKKRLQMLREGLLELRKELGLKKNEKMYVSMDAWFMRGFPINELLALKDENIIFFGCIRRNSIVFDKAKAPQEPKVGRPAKYGPRLTWDIIKNTVASKITEIRMKVGRDKVNGVWAESSGAVRILYYEFIGFVNFLKKRECRLVWSQIISSNGLSLSEERLYLCTDPSISGEQLIQEYSMRWAIEVFFHYAKHECPILADAWQQNMDTLENWYTFSAATYSIPTIIAALHPEETRELNHIPWRDYDPVTRTMAVGVLRFNFMYHTPSDFWDLKRGKLTLPLLRGRGKKYARAG
jgi:hypothetical protein